MSWSSSNKRKNVGFEGLKCFAFTKPSHLSRLCARYVSQSRFNSLDLSSFVAAFFRTYDSNLTAGLIYRTPNAERRNSVSGISCERRCHTRFTLASLIRDTTQKESCIVNSITFHRITDKKLALKEAIVTNNNIKLWCLFVLLKLGRVGFSL